MLSLFILFILFFSFDCFRLLYLFGDIICVVYRGGKAEHGTITKDLKDYAQDSVAGTINKSAKPPLILIFNQRNDKDGILFHSL